MGSEVCDGADLGGQSCLDFGFDSGTLACAASCQDFDTAGCDGGATCGDGVIEDDEVCDGADLDGQTCQDFGFAGGDLGCLGDCSDVDLSGCARPDSFSETPQTWSVPNLEDSAADDPGFYNTVRGGGSRHWALVELDGNDALELVHTGDPAHSFQAFGSHGSWHWKVYSAAAQP